MSVRNGILAILTIGPAYGLQLHGEFLARAAHRTGLNVGQVYSTLDRLVLQGSVRRAGTTDDGLPLYAITEAGSVEAGSWLGDAPPKNGEWTEMVDRVLIAASIPGVEIAPLISTYVSFWRNMAAAAAPADEIARLARGADASLGLAALRWLDEARLAADTGDLARGLSETRVRRGRRPTLDGRSAP